jgi:signal transduction histidine kinase
LLTVCLAEGGVSWIMIERRGAKTVSRASVSLKRRSARSATAEKKRLEAASNSCISLDAIGYIEDVTPDAARFLQRSCESLLRTPFAALVSEESRQLWLTHFLSNRRPGMRGNTTLVFDIDSSTCAVEVFTETSAALGTFHFLVTFRESSWTKADKISTREPSNLIGHIYELVITVDRRGKVGFTNQPLLDRSPNQVIGTSFYDYVRPFDLKRFRAAIHEAFESGTRTDFINQGLVYFPPGKHFRVRIKPLPVKSTAIGSRNAAETEMTMIVLDDITDQRRAEHQLNRMNHTRQRVARRTNLIREEERRRLALELHDQLGQSLTALKIDLSLVRRQIDRNSQARSALKLAESSVDELINLVRELSAELRPPLLDELGLIAALQFHMETFQKRTGIRCTLQSQTEEISTSAEIEIGVFRVFQETLTNIIRHSNASKLEVRLEINRGLLLLTVSDNGRGISEEALYSPNSLGLIGMHERAQQLGGAIHIRNGSTEGTTVVMQVPLSARRGRGQGREQR